MPSSKLPRRTSRRDRHWPAALLLLAFVLAGCSFDLGSMTPDSDKSQQAPQPGPTAVPPDNARSASEAQAHAAQGLALARSGQDEAALGEFNQALALDPYNAQALYGRGLIYQAHNQHDFAIADFSAASGLNPQKAEPLLARAISYLALDKPKEAAADMDEASQSDPNNAQVWATRGLAYERLGDRTKAAASYNRVLALRPRDEAARAGLARVGG
jgi:tetratricopeptide (TPR) repeat protein